ncbi:transcriptional regulator family: Fungal Specific TF [Penicillium alfredii]|uniref:Transcriptional regulator family: Fungal Specific TF n=1 Tax=Penicillium alfredii TaxID=1506179 RepID=A0A9W9EHK2_9EURO|nr:transcriptional regulator family: Fungal Specific TF [Penicillium alfredii]KAJ5081820.1 transcriptional regulator family: Fungal Specific TF [Penicillium alfredii]
MDGRSDQARRRTARACDSPHESQLSERISRIEQLLAENLKRDVSVSVPNELFHPSDGSATTGSSPSTSSQSLVPCSVGVHFAGKELGVISILTGIPFLVPEGQEWIKARTGQTISTDRVTPNHAPWEKERGQSTNALLMNLRNQNPFQMPDWSVVQLYFAAYKSCPVMRRIFPIVDVMLFEETIDEVYRQPPDSFRYGQASSRASVLAFLAFVSRLPPIKEFIQTLSHPPVDQDGLATLAQFLMPQVLQEPANLHGAEAVTMLTMFELSSGNMRATNYYAAVAVRLLFMLGANTTNPRTCPSEARGQLKREHARNLFWICYTIDSDVALRTGQPPIITDENCDLTLPPGYLERAFSDVESDAPYEGPVFPFDLRLSMIKSRAHRTLYSVSALKKSDAELLKGIRELDDQLEEWRLSVPPSWRPTMSFSPETPDPNMSMHSVMLRLNYYLCQTIIHQASGRCKAWFQSQTGIITEGISSSLALSVEASRSSLCYLEAAERVLVDGVFWTLVFYPMSALLTIFCSILQNPLDPHSREDLDRLRMASKMMDRIFSRKLPGNEVVQFKLVADFVMELKRLAECAIDKAWAEQRAVSHLAA